MPYSLHNRNEREDFRGGRNILASEHLQYFEAGGTLDAEVTGAVYLPLGTLLARSLTTGKFEPAAALTDLEGYDNPVVMNIDVDVDGENDVIVGELIVRGSVYEAKLPTEVPAFFKEATPMIRYVNHIA